ncbi:MAG: GAF domain-containing protein [Burkholderiaceae bacterium]
MGKVSQDLCVNAALAASQAVETADSIEAVGERLAQVMTGRIVLDRFNIGRIDAARHSFYDAYVIGQNVPGRSTGHQRSLHGSVVEAAIRAGVGDTFGSADKQAWLDRFPGFGPVYESGIRAMLAVPLKDDGVVFASLVFAACDPDAYDEQSLAVAVAVGEAVRDKILAVI